MNVVEFNRIMDEIKIGESYYNIVKSLNVQGYIRPSLAIKVDQLKRVGKEILGLVTYDNRDHSITKRWNLNVGCLEVVVVMKKGSNCEILIAYIGNSDNCGSNLPILAYEETLRNRPTEIPDPPYPR